MAQDRTLRHTTESFIANMKIKSNTFHKKKKSFFYNTHSLMKWKKHPINYWSESPPAGQKWFCGWKTSNGWSMGGALYNTHKITEEDISSAFGTIRSCRVFFFPRTWFTLQSTAYNLVNTDYGARGKTVFCNLNTPFGFLNSYSWIPVYHFEKYIKVIHYKYILYMVSIKLNLI